MSGRARFSLGGWRNRLLSSPAFQSWASRFPLTRRTARREGEAMFDLVAGFVHSQVLMALVELGVLETLRDGPQTAPALAIRHALPVGRMEILLQAGAALGLLARKRGDRFALTRRGAALLGVPGLDGMIRHHRVLYRDLSDPVAFLRGETSPELASFWPYVFGPGAEIAPDDARRYSDLMADSQALVAEETLRAVSFGGTRRLMDVGGGTGVFLSAVARAHPGLAGTLFDLPAVADQAAARFARDGLSGRLAVVPGSFRTDPLPEGADTISLVRVLYDHSDDTVSALLAAVFAALPDLVVDITHSGISTGTEKLFWSGEMPPFPGMGYPLVPGYEAAGEVVEAGPDDLFKVGERVFVPGANCYDGAFGLFGGCRPAGWSPTADRVTRIDRGLGPKARCWRWPPPRGTRWPADKTVPDLIVGHGVLGRLLARLTIAAGAPAPTVWEIDPDRAPGAGLRGHAPRQRRAPRLPRDL
jgi:demethylspheroidene O-methyltransferase